MPTSCSVDALLSDAPGLSGCTLLGHGANRMVLSDPADPGCCLKLELPAPARTSGSLRTRLRRRLARLFPQLGENAVELRAWHRLFTRLGADALAGRIAASHGIIETPAGPALRCELVRDADGRPAPSLYALLYETPRFTADALCAAVDDFEAWLQWHAIPLFDLNAGNFVVIDGDGGPRMICVDAKSTLSGKELLPLSRQLPALRRRKIARRAERLRKRIRTALPTGASLR
ncbi:YrbL family protein [Marilutibacter alkalisoli]|nr:YrbL family protein [Lysobacter alkalisoli]